MVSALESLFLGGFTEQICLPGPSLVMSDSEQDVILSKKNLSSSLEYTSNNEIYPEVKGNVVGRE
jgi:hypothetical protein